MGWKNCRPKSGVQCELWEPVGIEFFLAFDVVSGPLPMLLCNSNGRGAIERQKVRRKRLEATQRRVEEPNRPSESAALGVVIRGGELDEALVELDEIAVRFEPERLPRLVRLPELAGVE